MENMLVNVGVAQVKNDSNPMVMRTILGSCVGICVYDRMKKIGGLAHVLLPNDTSNGKLPEKYADTAIPLLVNQLIKNGAKKEFLSAKIAGGASMFKFESNLALSQIGQRNVEVTRDALEKLSIPITQEDIGGSTGRVIDFYLNDGHLKVKAGGEVKMYYKV